MSRATVTGVAVLRPKSGRGYDVIGVGLDPIGAIRDANWRDNQCRVPDACYFEERPHWLIVAAKITVSITPDAMKAGIAKRDRAASMAAQRKSGGAP